MSGVKDLLFGGFFNTRKTDTGTLSGNVTTFTFNNYSEEMQQALANLREVYFTRDILNTKEVLQRDLRLYVDQADISRMKMIILDELIPSFLRKICNVYDTPPLFKFDENIEEEKVEAFSELKNEVQLNRFMSETLERCRFHNTIIVQVRYFEPLDKIYIDNAWHAGNCEVEVYDGYDQDIKGFSYLKRFDGELYRVYWELVKMNDDGTAVTKHYKKLTSNGKVKEDAPRIPMGENETDDGPPYWPFVVYRYSERGGGFWGNAMDSLVELVRAINILLTVANDDTIQETIRILLLNFDATGTEGEDGQIKTGLRHPITPNSQIGQENMDAKILTADLYNDDVMKLIEGLWSVISNTHNVGNVLKPDFKQAVSSLALRVQNEPLIRDWEHDINVVMPLDMKLVKTLMAVHNYHREDRAIEGDVADSLLIEYQEPSVVTDEKDEYETEKMKWGDGTSSPLLYVMRKNPEMSEDEAKQFIQDNLAFIEEVGGLAVEVEDNDPQKVIDNE